MIAYLVFKIGVLSLQLDPYAAENNILYYVIAFAVGYREATFRELMKRLGEVILTPGQSAPAISGVFPGNGPIDGGTRVSITGTNLKSIGFVRFAGNDARIFGEARRIRT